MKYTLFCNNCGQKHFCDGNDLSGLTEVKSANPQKVGNEFQELPKKIKCYNCGMLFKIIKNTLPDQKPVEEKDEHFPSGEEYFKHWENEVIKSIRKKKQ